MSDGVTGSQEPIINITSEDLVTDVVQAQVDRMQEAQKFALVREVGAPTKQATAFASIATVLGAGALGGLAVFLVNKLLDTVVFDESTSSTVNNVSFSFTISALIGLFVTCAEPLFSKSFGKLKSTALLALPGVAGFGLLAGFISNKFYSSASESLYSQAYEMSNAYGWSEQQYMDYLISHNHMPRGIAWMICGIGVGLTIGLASKSGKRLGLGVAGGAVGGFLGGYLFDYIQIEAAAQIAGLVVLGSLIGGSVALLEQTAKSRWIEIVAGGMAGKQFILYKREVVIGSSPSADVTLIKDNGIAQHAISINVSGTDAQLRALSPNMPVYVNGNLASQIQLKDGDSVILGNTQIRFRERSAQGQMPGGVVR